MDERAMPRASDAVLADEVADYLSAQVRGGLLPIGGKLPTEAALGRQFGVSRAVAREAVARLKADGLVRSRQVSGLYVADREARRSFKVGDGTELDRAASRRCSNCARPSRPVPPGSPPNAAARRS